MPYAKIRYPSRTRSSGAIEWPCTWRSVPYSAQKGEHWAFVMALHSDMPTDPRRADFPVVGQIEEIVGELHLVPVGSRDTTARRPAICRIDMAAHRARAALEIELERLETEARELIARETPIAALRSIGTTHSSRLADRIAELRSQLDGE